MPDILCPIYQVAQSRPEDPAIIAADGFITFAELSTLAEQTSRWLTSQNFLPGDRMALHLHNSIEYAILLSAMFRTGVVACPFSIRIPTEAMRQQSRRVQPRAIVTDRDYLLSGLGGVSVLTLADLAIEDIAATAESASIPLDQPATILFTSGSAGLPKAVLHTYANHYYNALGSQANIPFGPGDRWLLSLPLYHVGGMGILFRAWTSGGAVVIPEPTEALAEVIGKYGITHLSLVSTQLYRLLFEETNVDFRPLKHVLLGGSAMPQKLIDAAVKRNLPIHTSYGLTEMASQVTATSLDDIPRKLHSSGQALPYREISVSPDGEILVRGDTLCAGYVNGPSIDRPFTESGWFATGDMGYLDADRYLHVTGRKDNMFVSGGENIHPEEIEEALSNLPEVAQSVVVPAEHPEYGYRPVAFVLMVQGRPLSVAHIREQLASALPRFKLPDRIFPWPEDLPVGLKPDRTAFSRLAASLSDFTG